MREAVGGWSLMNIFIVFFVIISFILIGTVIYYKGYKINSQIINSLEKYEGYNSLSASEIDHTLTNLGYRQAGKDNICGKSAHTGEPLPCLGENSKYEFNLTCSVSNKNKGDNFVGNNYYITYHVKTYIYINLPFGLSMKIPVSTKSNPIYQFTGYENGLGC